MISLNKYNQNKLLTYGAGIFTCSYIILFAYAFLFINTDEPDYEITIIPFFFGIIIAPLLEELIFRGIFVKRKVFIWLYIGGVIYYIITLKSLITIPLFIIHLRVLFLQRNNSQTHEFRSYYLSALIFSLMHYNISDGFDFISIMQISVRFSIGLILIWVTINFSLIASILIHAFNNLVVFSIQIIATQIGVGDADIDKTVHTENYTIKWNRPQEIFPNEKITFNKDTLTMQNQTFEYFLIHNGINTNNIDSIQLSPSFKTSKYNIILVKKDSVANNLKEKEIIKLLLKAKILNTKQTKLPR